MRGIDLLILGVLVAAVLFSGLGLAVYERVGGAQEFDVAFNEQSQALSAPQKTRGGAGTIDWNIPLNVSNLTEVKIDVVVGASGPRLTAVQAKAELKPPTDNITGTLSATTTFGQGAGPNQATLNLLVKLKVPQATKVNATSQTDAESEANAQYGSRVGAGTWKLVVTFTGMDPGNLRPETFNSLATGTAKTYNATVTLHTPDVGR